MPAQSEQGRYVYDILPTGGELEEDTIHNKVSEDDIEMSHLEINAKDLQNHESLLQSQSPNDEFSDKDTAIDVETDEVVSGAFGLNEKSGTCERLIVLLRQSAPVVASSFLGAGAYMINLVFAGQFVHSKRADAAAILAGVSLAVTFISVTWLSVVIGMSAAVETLCSQHNGAGNYRAVGMALLRACLIMIVIAMPVLVLWLYSYEIFSAMGIAHDVCMVIRAFVSVRMFGMPADIVMIVFGKFVMAVGVPEIRMWANAVFCSVVLLSNLLFVVHLQYDYHFLALAMVLGPYSCVATLLLIGWGHIEVRRAVLPLLRSEVSLAECASSGWWEFITLGVPGTVMLCSEWWAFEALAIMAAHLGTAEVAAETLAAQLANIAFRIPVALSMSAASLVGNMLGAHLNRLAVQIGRLALLLTGSLMLFVSSLMVLYGKAFIGIFSSESSVVAIAVKAIPALAVMMFMDALQTVAGGILRGVGRQELGAYANLVACYCFGLPLAYFFCFHLHYGVPGLIMGMTSASLTQATVLLTLVLCFENSLYKSKITAKVEHSEQQQKEKEVGMGSSDTTAAIFSSTFSADGKGKYEQLALAPALDIEEGAVATELEDNAMYNNSNSCSSSTGNIGSNSNSNSNNNSSNSCSISGEISLPEGT